MTAPMRRAPFQAYWSRTADQDLRQHFSGQDALLGLSGNGTLARGAGNGLLIGGDARIWGSCSWVHSRLWC